MAGAEVDDIDAVAAEWAVRAEQRGGEAVFAAELAAWLGADPRRAGALLRARAMLAYLDQGGVEARAARNEKRGWPRRAIVLGGLGTAAAAAVAGVLLLSPTTASLTTEAGQVEQISLADGSRVLLNGDSQVSSSLGRQRRDVVLVQGEAFFSVAKDPGRPFLVEAGDVRVMAVGTAFSVRRVPGGADVFVTEGQVEVWRAGGGPRIRVAAGQKVSGGPDAKVRAAPEEVAMDLAWRTGEIALYGQPLEEAVSQFNRRNRVKIRVSGEGLADQKIVGRFDANDPEGFSRAAALTLGAKVSRHGDEIVLTADMPA
ncbi:fec operon regulator FecR [compost metagenome]